MQTRNGNHKKTAVVLVNNEIVSNAVKSALTDLGYEVSQNIRSCVEANIGFIGSYFAILGILKQIKTINPMLPLVLIVDREHGEMEAIESVRDLYDVIKIADHSEIEIKKTVLRWFFEGMGKFLYKMKRTAKKNKRWKYEEDDCHVENLNRV